jgi:hypothetical protein
MNLKVMNTKMDLVDFQMLLMCVAIASPLIALLLAQLVCILGISIMFIAIALVIGVVCAIGATILEWNFL